MCTTEELPEVIGMWDELDTWRAGGPQGASLCEREVMLDVLWSFFSNFIPFSQDRAHCDGKG